MHRRTRALWAATALGATIALPAPAQATTQRAAAGTLATALAPGSYSTAQGMSFYVAPSGVDLQDVLIPTTLDCTSLPETMAMAMTSATTISIATLPSVTQVTQKGYYLSRKSTFTNTLEVDSLGGDGLSATGTSGETITWKDPSGKHTCKTGTKPWSATYDVQGPSQGSFAVTPGSYRVDMAHGRLDFFISANGKQIVDADVTDGLYCAPASGTPDRLQIFTASIKTDDSFAATRKLTSAIGRSYTFTLVGHVHGDDANGTPRVAGMFSETLTNADGSVCATDTHETTFSPALRDTAQHDDQRPDIQPGTYTAVVLPGGQSSETFDVSTDRKSVTHVSGTAQLNCVGPTSSFTDAFAVPLAAIAKDGSFTATATHRGLLAVGHPGTFTNTFRGHFHGDDNADKARIDGELLDTAVSDDGLYHCGSDPLDDWARDGAR
jgi:hypothetical protein